MKKNKKEESLYQIKGSLGNAMAEFDMAADFLSLAPEQRSFIKEPRFSIRMKLPIRMDNGQIINLKSYHAIHSIMRGPAIGGVQFRNDINEETVEALAFWSTQRCALLNIPFGGSYGAIDCDPTSYSAGELERISRRYIAELCQLVGPNSDILTADIGTNQQIMCWFMDTYSCHRKEQIYAVALDKPGDLGGTSYTIYPTAIGVHACIAKACQYIGLNIKNSKVAIQGFGKVGMDVAKLLYNAGAKIIAIADISGAYINESGINIDEIVWHQQSYGILDGIEGEMNIQKMDDPLDLFYLPVDILVPAAVELQITEQNMFNIKSKVIAEVAHDPVSPIADKYLYEKGVFVIPDILCNSGGSVGRYLEWVQNRTSYYWKVDKVQSEIEKIINRSFDNVMNIAKQYSISSRQAAAVLAVQRVAKAAELRGVYA